MFENPRRGRQARNFTTNVPKILDLKSSSEQVFSENCRSVPLARDGSAVKSHSNTRLLHNTARYAGWKYELRRASALLRNIQNIRICVGKKSYIVSVTYENERISIKNSLPYLKCVFCRICICCIKRFTKVGHSSEAARLIHRRKTAVNSLQ